MEEVKHERCGKCKSWRLPSLFLNEAGRRLKTCQSCRDRAKIRREANKCEHKRQRSSCKECGGSCICEHKKRRNRCIDCGGVSICEHKREKSKCKDCGGASICEHKKQRNQCIICQPLQHLYGVVCKRMRQSLDDFKGPQTIDLLGCDIQSYRDYIESKFLDNMNWENYGEWQIDHIIPLNYESPTIEEVMARLHYTNTQCLWARDNNIKGSRWIG
jgi:hypothetical protein